MGKFSFRLPRSRSLGQPSISYEHIEIFTKDSVARRDLGNRASPVDQAHNEEALNELSNISFLLKLIEFFKKIPLFSNGKTHCSRLREITSFGSKVLLMV